MKKLLAIVGILAFLASAAAVPDIHDSAEDAYPELHVAYNQA